MCAVDEAALASQPDRSGETPPEPERGNPVQRWLAAVFAHPWFAPLAVLGCFSAAAAGVVATDPTDNTGPSTCLFKIATGFDCPGCGGTRAFYYLVTLNLPEAARHHAVAVFAAPFIVWMYLAWALPRLFARRTWRLPTFHLAPGTLTAFLIAWGVFFIARNLPWEPFTFFFV
ncbi:DUF2752 domain-containing protein [Glycomyces sp. TRM65418]|uniref:DUF2752 domain-containing protein n=1 Tax=Glycomyces sp. TRM65418 TaxID=2867006 RepID=UPI001CE540CE|nr:DUF2752 domain-containing protein [Glycomyces sp. TRM65418]MCC3762280.1 DUF2752 domain-containing protein [Glycomyces sp. TRM65418]QZD56336.1 DUF2752 domain-containing protein [Glycomyces sp. TRM65418]